MSSRPLLRPPAMLRPKRFRNLSRRATGRSGWLGGGATPRRPARSKKAPVGETGAEFRESSRTANERVAGSVPLDYAV
jgi:hypothetical protein